MKLNELTIAQAKSVSCPRCGVEAGKDCKYTTWANREMACTGSAVYWQKVCSTVLNGNVADHPRI